MAGSHFSLSVKRKSSEIGKIFHNIAPQHQQGLHVFIHAEKRTRRRRHLCQYQLQSAHRAGINWVIIITVLNQVQLLDVIAG